MLLDADLQCPPEISAIDENVLSRDECGLHRAQKRSGGAELGDRAHTAGGGRADGLPDILLIRNAGLRRRRGRATLRQIK